MEKGSMELVEILLKNEADPNKEFVSVLIVMCETKIDTCTRM